MRHDTALFTSQASADKVVDRINNTRGTGVEFCIVRSARIGVNVGYAIDTYDVIGEFHHTVAESEVA